MQEILPLCLFFSGNEAIKGADKRSIRHTFGSLKKKHPASWHPEKEVPGEFYPDNTTTENYI
jgi:hypothetical protein